MLTYAVLISIGSNRVLVLELLSSLLSSCLMALLPTKLFRQSDARLCLQNLWFLD